MLPVDKTLTCRDCGTSFLFTAGEQEFYASRGFANEPSRCPECRAARRAGRTTPGGTEGAGRGADRPYRELHSTTCARCGKEALVPFIPRGDRPVYCSDCYERQRSHR